MKKSIFTILIASLIFITACGNNTKVDENADVESIKPDTVIMKIDGKNISKNDFDDAFDKLYITSPYGSAKVDLSKDKNYRIKLLFRTKAINDIIVRYFIEKEAEKQNINVPDQKVQEVYDEVVKRIGGETRLKDQLAVANMNEEKFRKSLKADILAKSVIDKLSENSNVSDAEVKEYYEKHKNDKFDVPETARAKHIFFKADERIIERDYRSKNRNASTQDINKFVESKIAEKRAKAQEALTKALASPDKFDDIAKEYSEDRLSAINGGDLGYIPKGKMLDEFNDVLFDNKKAQVGKPYPELVKTNIGFHIIKITDHRKGGIMVFDAVKDDIKRLLEDQKKIDLLTSFVKDKKAHASIEFIYPQFDETFIEKQLQADPNRPSNKATEDIKLKDNKTASKNTPKQTQ
ncbi:MAG: peptidylprolyl isomerase [Cyanobacteriota bacterium]